MISLPLTMVLSRSRDVVAWKGTFLTDTIRRTFAVKVGVLLAYPIFTYARPAVMISGWECFNRIFSMRIYGPVRRDFPILKIGMLRDIYLAPFTGAMTICGFRRIEIVMFLNGYFCRLYVFLLRSEIVEVKETFSVIYVMFNSYVRCVNQDNFVFSITTISGCARERARASIRYPLGCFFRLFINVPTMSSFNKVRNAPVHASVRYTYVVKSFRNYSFFQCVSVIMFLPRIVTSVLVYVGGPAAWEISLRNFSI